MKIVTVCGLGVGSSLIMKMTISKVIKKLGIKADVEHWDMGTVKSQNADLIVTTKELAKELNSYSNIIIMNNIMDEEEAEEKLKKYFNN